MTEPFTPTPSELGAFREVPFMGVTFVVHEAMKRGFVNGHPHWSNLGQGQPEVGPMEGAPPRIESVRIEPQDHAYGPLEGIPELREVVAAHYNRLYRRGMGSQYRPENVCVAQGGRSRIDTHLVPAHAEDGFVVPPARLEEEVSERGLGRFSFGPPMDNMTAELERLEQMVRIPYTADA